MSIRTFWHHLLGHDTRDQINDKRRQTHEEINVQTAKLLKSQLSLRAQTDEYLQHVQQHNQEMQTIADKIAKVAGR